MKKFFFIISFVLFTSFACSQDLGLSITAVMPSDSELSEESAKYLQGQMESLLTANGVISGLSDRFVIVAKIIREQKDITPITPVRILLKYKVSLYIGDIVEDKIYGREAITVSGIGLTETKAQINAFSKVNSNNGNISKFVKSSVSEIVNYYSNNCDRILNQANELSSIGHWEEAIAILSTIPKQCTDCYDKGFTKLNQIYLSKINTDCIGYIREAQSVWSVKNDYEHTRQALSVLLRVEPYSACFDEANNLASQINNKLRAMEVEAKERREMKEQRDWEYKVKVHNDDVELRKCTINAIRDVASSVGSALAGKTTNVINKW